MKKIGPSSMGEEKTINYIRGEFEKLGLKPGDGESYFQEVPLVSITTDPDTKLVIQAGEKYLSFEYGKDCMVSTKREMDTVTLKDSDMVFVGYGIVAPEYGWNDYEGLDVHGKTGVLSGHLGIAVGVGEFQIKLNVIAGILADEVLLEAGNKSAVAKRQRPVLGGAALEGDAVQGSRKIDQQLVAGPGRPG